MEFVQALQVQFNGLFVHVENVDELEAWSGRKCLVKKKVKRSEAGTSEHEGSADSAVGTMTVVADLIRAHWHPQEKETSRFQNAPDLLDLLHVAEWIYWIAVAAEAAVFDARERGHKVKRIEKSAIFWSCWHSVKTLLIR